MAHSSIDSLAELNAPRDNWNNTISKLSAENKPTDKESTVPRIKHDESLPCSPSRSENIITGRNFGSFGHGSRPSHPTNQNQPCDDDNEEGVIAQNNLLSPPPPGVFNIRVRSPVGPAAAKASLTGNRSHPTAPPPLLQVATIVLTSLNSATTSRGSTSTTPAGVWVAEAGSALVGLIEFPTAALLGARRLPNLSDPLVNDSGMSGVRVWRVAASLAFAEEVQPEFAAASSQVLRGITNLNFLRSSSNSTGTISTSGNSENVVLSASKRTTLSDPVCGYLSYYSASSV